MVSLLSYFLPEFCSTVIKLPKMAHFMYFLQVAAKKLVTVWAKVLSALERFF